MAEEIEDFDQWLKSVSIPEEKFCAVHDETGKILSIGPWIDDRLTKIEVDKEFSISIAEGKENILEYKVDLITRKLVKINPFVTYSLTRIDDVLHRVINKKWSDIENPDVAIKKTNNGLSFQLIKSVDGVWSGETEMIFLITDYNDPNVLKNTINFRVGDITGQEKHVDIDLPKKFSIYTRRLFENYVYEDV